MKKIPKTTGRPKVSIDWVQFDKLCGLQCTLNEISSYFECSPDTIERACMKAQALPFADYFAQKSGKKKVSLRRALWRMAFDKTEPATVRRSLLWNLGEQYLGFSRKQEIRIEDLSEDDLARVVREKMGVSDEKGKPNSLQRVSRSPGGTD